MSVRFLLAALLLLLAAAPAAHATFPGRNGELVYTVDRSTAGGQGETKLETVGPRGLGRRVISLCGDDEWGPCDDGWHLLVETLGGLWRVRADGKQPDLVLEHGRNPDWAAGGRIVYEADDDLYMREQSGAIRRLTRRGGAQPSWSPGGRWVAFERNDDVYLVRRGGRGLRRLTRIGGRNPAWSPDGRRIAFVRAGSLFTVGIRGRGLRHLVEGSLGDGHAVADVDWRPLP